MTSALRRLIRIRAKLDRRSTPHAIALRKSSTPILQRLYPGFTINEIKALFPLKKTGSGPGTRYIVVPKIVEKWLDELPSA